MVLIECENRKGYTEVDIRRSIHDKNIGIINLLNNNPYRILNEVRKFVKEYYCNKGFKVRIDEDKIVNYISISWE